MTRILLTRFALAVALCVLAAPASAQASEVLTPVEAVECALGSADAAEEGVSVTVQGEAVGEALSAPGARRWVNLYGDGTALGVVVSERDAESIPAFGEYRRRGATVRATGTLRLGCDEHGGDLDLHASSVVVLDTGEELPHAVHPAKLWLALAALALALLLWVRYRQLRRRSYLA